MECRIYIFPTDDELEWLSYPDIDWDSLIESYKKKTHTHTHDYDNMI